MSTVRDRVDELEEKVAALETKVESAFQAAIAAKSPPPPEATSPAPEAAETAATPETPA